MKIKFLKKIIFDIYKINIKDINIFLYKVMFHVKHYLVFILNYLNKKYTNIKYENLLLFKIVD